MQLPRAKKKKDEITIEKCNKMKMMHLKKKDKGKKVTSIKSKKYAFSC